MRRLCTTAESAEIGNLTEESGILQYTGSFCLNNILEHSGPTHRMLKAHITHALLGTICFLFSRELCLQWLTIRVS